MIKEAEGAEGAEGAGGEVFWLGCLIMVNHPDLILSPQGGNGQEEKILILLLLNDVKTQQEIAKFIGCSTNRVCYWYSSSQLKFS